MRRTKTGTSLFFSAVALFLCFAMLLGATYAWFTDSVTSTGNKIEAGTLEVDLQLLNENGGWKSLKAEKDPIWDAETNKLWEPGYVDVKIFKVVNNGTLALKWKAAFTSDEELSALADVIEVYVMSWGVLSDADAQTKVDYPTNRDLTGYTKVGTLRDFVNNISSTTYGRLEFAQSAYLGIALKMLETADNTYQGLTLGAFDIHIIATQEVEEDDAFDNTYDEGAEWPFIPGYVSYQSPKVTVPMENGVSTEEVTIGNEQFSAVIPAGTKFAEGYDSTSISVQTMHSSNANIVLETGEVKQSYDIHIEGLAEDNDTPVPVVLKNFLKPGLNSTSVGMSHVEDGITVEMTLMDTPVNHNEFSYDPATGDVVLSIAGCSEIVAVVDNRNLWEGDFDYSWYVGKSSPYIISSADQLAGFGRIVDGTAEGIAADTFEGDIVRLGADIDLSGGHSLNPIGSGYVNGTKNSGGSEGRSFRGTFDGGKYDSEGNLTGVYTIRYLYQNGWDIGLSYCNLGGGLFGSVCNAIIKNLNIVDAEIVMECVEQGVVAGLAQGNCTFENIAISNCSVANYQKATGGVVGEVSWGIGDATEFTHTFRNIRIDNKTVVGSLWGDFDAPVGGVIGARWDDSDRTNVVMENIEVACRLDVYNDVTSSYQWYAYRRAGMLIGNTEQEKVKDGHTTASADFLTCSNVSVYYGSWTKYHYCEFNNHNPNWPFVRVEAGEHCTAYSNPRYGVPNDPETGKPVTDINHSHATGDDHNVELEFNQLYGGGQGVYGETEHTGVEIVNYAYTITYINDYQVLDVKYVTEAEAKNAVNTANDTAKVLVEKWAAQNIKGTWEFGGWMNAGSTKLTKIDANNNEDITLYPYFNKPYTARFVDQNGNVLEWCLFHKEDLTKLDATLAAAQARLPALGKDFAFDHWEVNANGTKVAYNVNNFKNYSYDVTIYPVYQYTGNLNLNPVDEDNDGVIEYYQVEAVKALDETTIIPGNVNGVPVKIVVKLYKNDNNWDFGSNVQTIIIEEGVEVLQRNSLGYTKNLETVELPSTITTLEKNVFSRNTGDDEKAITIKYNGTMADWEKITKNKDWHNGLETGTRVVCSDGYYELKAEEYLWGAYETYEWTPHPNS